MSTGSEDMILPAPPGRCIRFNCLRRRKIRVVVEEGDEDRYHVDKIVGRRAVARHTDGSRIFEYLVLWDGWPIEDGTW
jgi:hypothetical protein